MNLSKKIINDILTKKILVNELSSSQLSEFCIYANEKYRSGDPVISDADYDFIFLKELKKRNPSHHLLNIVEPEVHGFSEEKVLIPKPMLSIDKAYSFDEILKWIDRIFKSTNELSLDIKKLIFRATPKLDGFAGFDDGKRLYTRGDGKRGSDITRVFNRGNLVNNIINMIKIISF